jgi:hypothetical protein
MEGNVQGMESRINEAILILSFPQCSSTVENESSSSCLVRLVKVNTIYFDGLIGALLTPTIMSNIEAAKSIAPPPPVSPPLVTTTLQALQPSRVKPGVPSNFDGDRAQGCTFLMSCELYISLTASDFVNEQVHIHWALSYFKGGHAASFAERILRQELRSGKMSFTSWSDFTEEFVLVLCPENKATTALM